MRRSLFLSLLLLCFLIVGCTASEIEKVEWQQDQIKSFITYYGNNFTGVSDIDVAIIDTRNFADHASDRKKLVKKLHHEGMYVITYISVGEDVDQYNPTLEMKSYYYDADNDGKPDRNPFWNSIYVNANDKEWHAEVLERIQHDAVDMGADGIFMDTIDTVGVFPETKDGMIELIRTIKETYPDLKLIGNRGFDILEEMAPNIDGLMFESFTASWKETGEYGELPEQDRKFSARTAKKLNEVRDKYPIPIFVLDYVAEEDEELIQKVYDRAWEHGFVPSVANKMLDKIYIHSIQPRTEWGAKIDHEMDEFGNRPDPIVDPNNVALASSGATIIVDSTFPHYSSKSLNDGFRHESALTWDEIAWASNTTNKNHWVEITFSQKQKLDRIDIYWALDNGKFFSSQGYEVRYRTDAGDWETLITVMESESQIEMSSIPVDGAIETDAVRIFQDHNKGPVNYTSPNIMWISEIEVYKIP